MPQRVVGYITIGGGVLALVFALVEAFPAIFHILAWLGSNVFGAGHTMAEIARGSPSFNFLKFHGLPSGHACPLFLLIGLGACLLGGMLQEAGIAAQERMKKEAAARAAAESAADQRRLAAEADQEYERRKELAQIEANKSLQASLYATVRKIGDHSLAIFESMPKHLMTTEELLDQAQRDFEEGAFAPFWDSVERAARKLGELDESVRAITYNSERYASLAKGYLGATPPFPIALESVTGMAVARTRAERLKGIVRTAQRNFQFATIFEHRKTNQLLAAGFTNLAEALNGMSDRLQTSLAGLSDRISDMSVSISDMSYGMRESLTELGTGLNDTLSSIHEESMAASAQHIQALDSRLSSMHNQMEKEARERANRHDRALSMLDNIQRRRRPAL